MSSTIPTRLKAFIAVQFVLGLLLIALIVFAGLNVPPLLQEESRLLERIEQLESQLEAREAELRESQAAIQQSEARIEALGQEEEELLERTRLLEIRVREQEVVQQQLVQASEAAQNQLASDNVIAARGYLASVREIARASRPRVYIQYVADDQVGTANAIAAGLNAIAVTVPPYEQVGRGPASSEFRYFRRGEEELAQRVYRVITDSTPELDIRFVFVPGYEDSQNIRDNHFEVWIAAPDRNSAAAE